MDGKTLGVGSIYVTNSGAIQSYTASGNLRGYFAAVESAGGTAAGLVIATSGGETISFKDGGLSGTLNAEINGSGDLNLITGTLDINGTTVIDASRNLTNIGTINSTHFFTSSNMNGTGVGGLNIHSGRLGFDQSGTRSWTVGAASGYLNIYSGDGNGDLNLASSIGLRLNGTTVIDASREIQNVPRIFFNGGLQAIDLNNADSLIFDTPDGHSALLLSGGSYDTNYHSNTTHFFRGTDLLDFHAQIDTSGIKSFGDYKVGGTTVIDASRNLSLIHLYSCRRTNLCRPRCSHHH